MIQKHSCQINGFSLLELMLALTIFSVVSVTAVALLFSSLSLRDQTIASAQTEEAVKVFDHTFQRATRNAKTVTGGGASIYTTTDTECWSLVWNSTTRTVQFSHIEASGCTPDTNPSTQFLPASVFAENLNFTINSLATGGRQVSVSGVFSGIQPLSTYQTSFSNTSVNLVD